MDCLVHDEVMPEKLVIFWLGKMQKNSHQGLVMRDRKTFTGLLSIFLLRSFSPRTAFLNVSVCDQLIHFYQFISMENID